MTPGANVQKDPVKVVYVMGYGRSGSTFLDVLLGGHSDVASMGELALYAEWRSLDLPCGCGESVTTCEFWSEVERLAPTGDPNDEIALALSVEARRHIGDLLQGRIDAQTLSRYSTLLEGRFRAIAEVSGRGHVVDSSKSAGKILGRAYALQRHTDLDVRVIHLVRDGRGVLWSALKGPGRGEPLPVYRAKVHKNRIMMAMRVSAAWALANRSTLKVAKHLATGTLLTVRYEDLVADPAAELTRIGGFLGLDLAPVITKLAEGVPFDGQHGVAGNRLRANARINLRPDFEWETKLSLRYRLIQNLIAGRVSRELGYPATPGGASDAGPVEAAVGRPSA
ncbi:MAG: sulfotransferase family protein [Longimicrobiales bacterium]